MIIPKPGKDNYGLAKSYRCISLLNCLSKIAEKMAAMMVSAHCEATEGLPPGTILLQGETLSHRRSRSHHRSDPRSVEPGPQRLFAPKGEERGLGRMPSQVDRQLHER